MTAPSEITTDPRGSQDPAVMHAAWVDAFLASLRTMLLTAVPGSICAEPRVLPLKCGDPGSGKHYEDSGERSVTIRFKAKLPDAEPAPDHVAKAP